MRLSSSTGKGVSLSSTAAASPLKTRLRSLKGNLSKGATRSRALEGSTLGFSQKKFLGGARELLKVSRGSGIFEGAKHWEELGFCG